MSKLSELKTALFELLDKHDVSIEYFDGRLLFVDEMSERRVLSYALPSEILIRADNISECDDVHVRACRKDIAEELVWSKTMRDKYKSESKSRSYRQTAYEAAIAYDELEFFLFAIEWLGLVILNPSALHKVLENLNTDWSCKKLLDIA